MSLGGSSNLPAHFVRSDRFALDPMHHLFGDQDLLRQRVVLGLALGDPRLGGVDLHDPGPLLHSGKLLLLRQHFQDPGDQAASPACQ